MFICKMLSGLVTKRRAIWRSWSLIGRLLTLRKFNLVRKNYSMFVPENLERKIYFMFVPENLVRKTTKM